MHTKPFSQACENNKIPILTVLKKSFSNVKNILEIGSGTGQHAVYFSKNLPHLLWQTSDCQDNINGINLWLNNAKNINIKPPIELDVNMAEWPVTKIDGIFTANTLHIMSWQSVINFFSGIKKNLQKGGVFCVYGPFNYNGRYTSESNAQFDVLLKRQISHRAIRDFEKVSELAQQAGLVLVKDYAMPANNRLLEWRKI
jgi:cyclopropane fatty-acyl-phospholipid synthase-like methyltransferase